MNVTQFLELLAIGRADGVIHKTIAVQLHRVTTQVRDKDKYHWKHSVPNNIK